MCEKLHMQARVHIFEIWTTNNYTSVVNMNKFIFSQCERVKEVARRDTTITLQWWGWVTEILLGEKGFRKLGHCQQ